MIALHTTSDFLISSSYFTIPLTLAILLKRRRDIPVGWILACFGIFITACGTTHIMQIWNIWHSDYWLEGAIKAITAVASVLTAVLLWRLLPLLTMLRTPTQLEAVNAELQEQVRQNSDFASRLQRSNDQLVAEIRQREDLESRLRASVAEAESFNRRLVGRELKMVELKAEVDQLLAQAGQSPRYGTGQERES